MRRALLVLVLWSASLAGCTNVFFQPMRGHVATPERIGLAYQDVYFESADGVRLHGWLSRRRVPRRQQSSFCTATRKHQHPYRIGLLAAETGFQRVPAGLSRLWPVAGHAIDGRVMNDIGAAFDTLLARPDVDPRRIVVFGQSLGGSLAISYVARSPRRDRIRALAVESAFSDFRGIAQEKLASFWLTWPFQWLPAFAIDNDYSPLRAIDQVAPIPLLLIYDEHDVIVPVQHGRDLHARARAPKELWIVPDAGHIEAMRTPENRKRFVAWMRMQLGTQR